MKMNESKGFSIASVVFLALVFGSRIPIVKPFSDRVWEAVTGISETKLNRDRAQWQELLREQREGLLGATGWEYAKKRFERPELSR
jgi:hypothetical protein